jgi:hypothetical protein
MAALLTMRREGSGIRGNSALLYLFVFGYIRALFRSG